MSCVPVNESLVSFCTGLVSYTVLSSLNISEGLSLTGNSFDLISITADSAAQSQVDLGGCPYYTTSAFACRKYFPPCITNSNNANESLKLCRDSCYYGRKWNDGLCSQYSDSYFSDQCSNSTYFSDVSPCSNAPGFSVEEQFPPWKIALIVIFTVIGAGILLWWGRTWWIERQDRKAVAKEEAVYDENERRRAEQRSMALQQVRQQNTGVGSHRAQHDTNKPQTVNVHSSHPGPEFVDPNETLVEMPADD